MLILATSLLTIASCAELCSTEAVRYYGMLNAAAMFTRRDSERAAFLVRDDNGRLRAVLWQAGETTAASYTGRIPTGSIAIIHTHPINAPQPSRRDVAEAERLRVPVVVITPDVVTAAMPDGSIVEVLGRKWRARN